MDSESCTRAFSQARVYLEQIRSRVAPGAVDIHGTGKRDYLVDAAKQIRLALERDVSEDYEEAFNHYKNGVDVLLNGVQVEPNKERREAVKRKITQYLKRAEEIFICHLQRNLGNGNSTETGYSSLRFRPIRTLSTPVENLKRCKVVGIIDKVQLVQDPATGGTFILKSLPKSHVETRERQTIIPHGIPFMAELLCYSVSEDSIFLHLEHVKGGTLWCHLHSQPHLQSNASDSSHALNPKLSLALGQTSEESFVRNSQEADSVSQQSCSIYHENRVGPTHVNPRLLRSDDHSFTWSTTKTMTNHKWSIEPTSGPQEVAGGKELCVSRALFGATELGLKQVPQGHRYLTNQGLIFQSWDSVAAVDYIGSIPERATPQQEPKLLTGEQCGGSHLKAERRQLRDERCFMQEESILDQKKHKSQLPSEHQGFLAHLAVQRHSSGTWNIKEDQIQVWAAELILALEGLHQQGVLCQDLNPRNLLLDDTGHIRLTYFGQWSEVERQCCTQALEDLYCAPEVGGISELTEACDWWSFGALLYELLSGTSLAQNHPSGIHPHTQLHLPERLSHSASSLLSELLQYEPNQRLGSGEEGVNKIKSHPFFSTIQWNKLVAS
ncbi:ribosomal protein S6 kinase-like 1 [Varanus komodoensis]|uniref:ribosomal protein S6 kinase-like 1 n=1 Tax=Varanus komodoensis TaxID=61221 RepID=UPI001CF76B14|nr:ribosomal protein S6 kinase-like 1 [Varanus komodoensis]XP_044292101.1 ribosomal protein S6 kinase-like 1 [Varanus komodoensis]XP_044292102.1 ribosomal protein S6 kinase-like 1 [Varanus komodoensis]